MINQIITNIKQDLLQILTPDQMEALSRSLNKHLPMLAGDKPVAENTKHDMLPLFIAAKRVEGCSEKSLRYYESTIRNMLEAINKPECQISTEDLRGYLDTYQRRGTVSKVTLDNVRRILSSFFAWLEDEDYIVKSPVRRIHKVKTGKTVKETYSDEALELIHAQQSEGMKTQDVWKKWLELHIPSVESIGGEHSELIDEMQGAINADKLERTVFESIQQKVLGLLSVSGNTEYMHSIANLALLNTADNAALNNSTFDVKRNDIIQMDKRGQYIPFCTKMVFLKYYTPSAENQLHFWGQADRIAYIKAINDVLSDYIEPIVLEKEETK